MSNREGAKRSTIGSLKGRPWKRSFTPWAEMGRKEEQAMASSNLEKQLCYGGSVWLDLQDILPCKAIQEGFEHQVFPSAVQLQQLIAKMFLFKH